MSYTLAVQRQAQNGEWFDIGSGAAVRPNEFCRLAYDGFGAGLTTVELRIISGLDGTLSWGPQQDNILLGNGFQSFQASNDSSLASYSAILMTLARPFPWQEKPNLAVAFFVDPQAPGTPKERPGLSWKTVAVVGAVAVGLVAVAVLLGPTLKTVNQAARRYIPPPTPRK